MKTLISADNRFSGRGFSQNFAEDFEPKTEVRLRTAAKRAKPKGVATLGGVIPQGGSEPKAFSLRHLDGLL